MLGLSPSFTLFCAKHYECCLIVVFIFVGRFVFKVSYDLIIISLVPITGLIVL